ncbi:MAG: alkaline phytoceramidase [Bryobacteraceae bacterium]
MTREVFLTQPHKKLVAWVLIVLATAGAGAACFLPPLTDSPAYFQFADRRTILGVPRFMDVASNASFAIVGVLGLMFLWRSRRRPSALSVCEPWEWLAFATFFVGTVLIAAGSAYFHLEPSPATLFWDRLPMAIAFMSLFALAAGDRLDARAGRILFAPLLACGIGSVLYWRHTGDLRFYLPVQFFPMLALPLLALLPARYIRRSDLAALVGFYAVAKLLEFEDGQVLAVTGWIGGHSLKHIAAAMAAAMLLRTVRPRDP